VHEAVEVLNDGEMANTTARRLSDDLTSADASLEDIVELLTVVSPGAEAPVRPFGQFAINWRQVGSTNDGPLSGVSGGSNVIEIDGSVMEKSKILTTQGRGRDGTTLESNWNGERER